MALRRGARQRGRRGLTAGRRSAKPQERVRLPPAPLIAFPVVPLSRFIRTGRRRARGPPPAVAGDRIHDLDEAGGPKRRAAATEGGKPWESSPGFVMPGLPPGN